MKTFIVLLRINNLLKRFTVAAVNKDTAENIALNRFGGVVVNTIAA